MITSMQDRFYHLKGIIIVKTRLNSTLTPVLMKIYIKFSYVNFFSSGKPTSQKQFKGIELRGTTPFHDKTVARWARAWLAPLAFLLVNLNLHFDHVFQNFPISSISGIVRWPSLDTLLMIESNGIEGVGFKNSIFDFELVDEFASIVES